MFEDVRGWMETPVESDDLLGLGKIPYSVVQLGLCLGIEYRDVYEIDHNYRCVLFAHYCVHTNTLLLKLCDAEENCYN